MKKALKIFKVTMISLLVIVLVMVLGLVVYTADSYKPLPEMTDAIALLNTDEVEEKNDFDQISYMVEQPKKNIVIVPGGKVNPESYQYLAINLALSSYDVTIVKTAFNLAILTPNYGARFLKDDMDNVVIGHSLGGTVASIFSQKDDRVSDMIFLASYPIADVSDKHVLVITAEFDHVLDMNSLEESKKFLPLDYVSYEILGGNHGQFGWYGEQKDDGQAEISTKAQQDIIVATILGFV